MNKKNVSYIIYKYVKQQYTCKNFYNLFYTLLIIVLYIFTIKPLYKLDNTTLAFSFSIVYRGNIRDRKKIIRSIEFKGTNNTIRKQNLFNRHTFHKLNHAIEFIYDIKFSGLMYKTKSYSVIKKNKKYNIYKIIVNPLLKKIVICHSKHLKIPKSLLIKYFIVHLGSPQDYNKLNSSINYVYSWYKKRGFNHVFIDLDNSRDKNHIYLKIHEGIIKDIYLISDYCVSFNSIFHNRIEKRIKRELSIYPGQVLNTKKLDLGIKKLHNINLISKCKYKIIRQNQQIRLIILYNSYINSSQHLNDQITCLTSRKDSEINFEQSISIIYKYINKLLHFYIPYQIKRKIAVPFLYPFNRCIKMLKKSLYFKYIKIYISNYNCKNSVYEIKVLNNNTIFDIILAYPSMYIKKSFFINFYIQIYKKIYDSEVTYPINFINIKNITQSVRHIFKIKIRLDNIQVIFEHNLSSYVNLVERASYVNHHISQNLWLIINKYLCSRYDSTSYLKVSTLKSLYRAIKKNILLVNAIIKRSNNYTDLYTQEGNSLVIEIMSIIYLPFKKLNINYLKQKIEQYLIINYHCIFKIIPFIKKYKTQYNFLFTSIALYWPIQNIDYLSIDYNNLLLYKYRYKLFGNNYSMSYKYDIEYHMIFHSSYSIYIFNRYINKDPVCRSIIFRNHINLSLLDMYTYYKYDTHLGFGIQLKAPIQNLTNLRIEYYISNNRKKFFHLRFYSKNIEYKI